VDPFERLVMVPPRHCDFRRQQLAIRHWTPSNLG
jgi:hypothetical protein